MMSTATGTIDSNDSLISLSLKPRRNWYSFIMAIVNFCFALVGIAVVVMKWIIYEISEVLYLQGIISEAPTEQYDWLMIALVVFVVLMGVNATTNVKKSFWLTKDLDKDINTKDVVILRPIAKSDLK